MIAPPAVGYTVIVYMLTYGTMVVGFDRSTLLTLILMPTVVWIGTIAVSALVADGVGSQRVLQRGPSRPCCGRSRCSHLSIPGTPARRSSHSWSRLSCRASWPAQGGLFTELFDVHFRYSGISIAYQFGGMIGGAVTPIAATGLYGAYSSSTPIALYVIALCFASLLAVLGLRPRYAVATERNAR